jgi:hypothetical protein
MPVRRIKRLPDSIQSRGKNGAKAPGLGVTRRPLQVSDTHRGGCGHR